MPAKIPATKPPTAPPKKPVETQEEDLSRYTIDSKEKANENIADDLSTPKTKLFSKNNKKVKVEDKIDLEQIPLEKRNANLYYVGIIVSIIIVLTTAGLLFARLNLKGRETQEVVTKEEEVAFVATATPTESQEETRQVTQKNRDEITIEILNASGIAGQAGKNASIFEELGYLDISTGNSEEANGNKFFVNPDYQDQLEILIKDIEEKLNITKVSGDLDDSEYMARIILGT